MRKEYKGIEFTLVAFGTEEVFAASSTDAFVPEYSRDSDDLPIMPAK